MSQFTSGKFGRAMCDRCGYEVKYKELKAEWTGLKVCSKCWDPKTELEFPTNFPTDPEALKDPRSDNDIEAGDGRIYTDTVIGSTIHGFELECELGNVTVTLV